MGVGFADWLKADLHVHTPADGTKSFGEEFGLAVREQEAGKPQKLQAIAKRFRDACVSVGLELVAVTDHNSCHGYFAMAPHLAALDAAARATGDPMVTFLPGVELTVGSERPIHVLLVFECDASFADVDGCISHVFTPAPRFEEATGNPRSANITVPQLLEKVREYCKPATKERDVQYLAIPAHVADQSGLIKELRGSIHRLVVQHQDWNGFQSNGPFVKQSADFQDMLTQWVAAKRGYAWEGLEPGIKARFKVLEHWPLVESSDPVNYAEIGKRFTYLKMENPSLEGVRLALLDPESRLRLGSEGCVVCDYPYITRIRVQNTALFADQGIAMSPHMNTLIGGRGTGKTSLLEYVRYCLDRFRPEDFVGETKDVSEELRRFLGSSKNGGGTLSPEHRITTAVKVGEATYEITRDSSGIHASKDGTRLDPSAFDARALLEPVIMSQRQMASIARDAQAQRLVLDSLIPASIRQRSASESEAARTALMKAQAERDIVAAKQTQLAATQTQLSRVESQISAVNAPGNEEAIAAHEDRISGSAWLDEAQDSLLALKDELEESASRIGRTIENLPETEQTRKFPWLSARRAEVVASLTNASATLTALAREAEAQRSDLIAKRGADWRPLADAAAAKYSELAAALKPTGIDLAHRGELSGQRRELRTSADRLNKELERLPMLEQAVDDSRRRLLAAHRELTAGRTAVTEELRKQGADVEIAVRPQQDGVGLRDNFDAWFGGTGMRRADWDLVVDFVLATPGLEFDRLQQVVVALRKDHVAAAGGTGLNLNDAALTGLLDGDTALSGHYAPAAAAMSPARLNEIEAFIPDDRIDAKYRDNDGRMKPIEEGSLGQRSTAILALLLASGSQPLIIDQPEDDIDNRYVYDVVVNLLRKRKFQRQIIVASHNANIPVNGDSELIATLTVREGQASVAESGSIDRAEVKATVSDVMEGSREAFALRHQRYGF